MRDRGRVAARRLFSFGTLGLEITGGNHAVDKSALIHEIHRVLKPGGCYVSLDVFQNRDVRPVRKKLALNVPCAVGRACVSSDLNRFAAFAKEVGL